VHRISVCLRSIATTEEQKQFIGGLVKWCIRKFRNAEYHYKIGPGHEKSILS